MTSPTPEAAEPTNALVSSIFWSGYKSVRDQTTEQEAIYAGRRALYNAGRDAERARVAAEIERLKGDVTIDSLGGNCPVQAEGTIDGEPFYFRARGEHWTLYIGLDPVGGGHWELGGLYSDEEFAAGWMSEDEARAFIGRGAAAYRAFRFYAQPITQEPLTATPSAGGEKP